MKYLYMLMVMIVSAGCDVAFFETKPKFFQGQPVSVVEGFHKGYYGKIVDTKYHYTPSPHRQYLVEKHVFSKEWIKESELTPRTGEE